MSRLKGIVVFTLMVAGAIVLLKIAKPYAPAAAQPYLPA